jgi:GTP cyclohydrolase IA
MNYVKRDLMLASRCNEAVAVPLNSAQEQAMIAAAAEKIAELFDVLLIDHRNDHNTRETPERVARMMVRELLRGRFSATPKITEFENAEGFDHLIVTGPIMVRSICAHHLMPIYGEAFVGVVPAPDGKVIGLSKYDRIVDHFAGRFQIQEELVKQVAGFIEDVTKPLGLAVRISAVHMCRTHRGVHAGHANRMVSTVYCGSMLTSPALRDEFLRECHALGRENH